MQIVAIALWSSRRRSDRPGEVVRSWRSSEDLLESTIEFSGRMAIRPSSFPVRMPRWFPLQHRPDGADPGGLWRLGIDARLGTHPPSSIRPPRVSTEGV